MVRKLHRTALGRRPPIRARRGIGADSTDADGRAGKGIPDGFKLALSVLTLQCKAELFKSVAV